MNLISISRQSSARRHVVCRATNPFRTGPPCSPPWPKGESRIENFLVSGVTQAMLDALTALGVPWQLDRTARCTRRRGAAARAAQPRPRPLDCGNSATTLRLLAGALAAAGVSAALDGSAGLRRRPMDRIVEPLQQMGVSIQATPAAAPR